MSPLDSTNTPTTTELNAELDPEIDSPATTLASQADMLARIQGEFANRPASPRVTLQELYDQLIALVASATGKRYRNGIPQLSENSAVKLMELTMMWALNNRTTPSHDILPSEVGEPAQASPSTLVPNQLIEATPNTDTTE